MKIKLSEVKQIIKEEVDRYKKIQLLETKKKSIEKELKEFLKEIEEEEVEEGVEHNPKKYNEEISKLAKQLEDFQIKWSVNFGKMTVDALIEKVRHNYNKGYKEVEEGIGMSLTNKKGINSKPEAGHLKEEEMEEGIGISKMIEKGQNKKPETPHKKERY